MNFYLKALVGIFSSDKMEKLKLKNKRWEKIEELKQQLLKEGYQPSEVDHFIKLSAGTVKVFDLDNNQLDEVIERLEEHIRIAQRCKNIFK